LVTKNVIGRMGVKKFFSGCIDIGNCLSFVEIIAAIESPLFWIFAIMIGIFCSGTFFVWYGDASGK